MNRSIFITAILLTNLACSSNNHGNSNDGSANNGIINEDTIPGDTTPAPTFTGTEAEQTSECEAVAALAPTQTSVNYIGNIWREEVNSDTEFTQLWNQVTPENAGKWGEVEAVRDTMLWERLDTAVAFAQNNGLAYKFHTLVWGANQPKWLVNLSAEQQVVEIEQWMNQLAQRFPAMAQIDVVNEPLHAPPSYKNALNLFDTTIETTTQWAWVVNTFAKARQVFPGSELLLNDFNILRSNENTTQYLEIIEQLQSNSLIDGIGLQAHFLEQSNADTVRANLDRLGATGLPLYISEFDLNIADDQQQLEKMRQIFPVFYTSGHVKGITLWGFRENQLWQANARLINADGTMRPAMKWLACYLSNAR